MIEQIKSLARDFNNNNARIYMSDTEKVAGAFCLFLLVVYFFLRDVILFITAPFWIIPYLVYRSAQWTKEN